MFLNRVARKIGSDNPKPLIPLNVLITAPRPHTSKGGQLGLESYLTWLRGHRHLTKK